MSPNVKRVMLPEEFVTEWIASFKRKETLQQFAKRLGRSPADVRKRKRRYQSHGVNLPELSDEPQGNNYPIEADKLNELMKELL